MSLESAPSLLSAAYERALHASHPWEVTPIRRAFRRAFEALDAGDLRPAVLLTACYP